jgi:hypothetical protein
LSFVVAAPEPPFLIDSHYADLQCPFEWFGFDGEPFRTAGAYVQMDLSPSLVGHLAIEDESEGNLEIVTSISSDLSKLTMETSIHRREWVTRIQTDYVNPSSLCHQPHPFLVKLPRPTKPKWGAKYGPEVVCMVVPPVPFEREGKVNVVKVTTFAQNCCARENILAAFFGKGFLYPTQSIRFSPIWRWLRTAIHLSPLLPGPKRLLLTMTKKQLPPLLLPGPLTKRLRLLKA